MPIIDEVGKQHTTKSLFWRTIQLYYSLLVGVVFAAFEIALFIGVPLYAAHQTGVISQTAYSGATLALAFMTLLVTAGRTGPSNMWVHWTSPWPQWWAVGRFARNWIAAIRNDGILQLVVFYGLAAVIGAVGLAAAQQAGGTSVAIGVVAYLALLGYGELYNVEIVNKYFWRRL